MRRFRSCEHGSALGIVGRGGGVEERRREEDTRRERESY
jgi:hypothetical protein